MAQRSGWPFAFAAMAAAMAVAAPALAGPAAWQIQASGTQVELRGLSVVSPTVAWASGGKGTVLRTIDGNAWTVLAVPGAEKLDFRDIHAFDADTAIAMSAGPGEASRIYRTADGGATWQLAITNPDPRGFWDAIAFRDARNGILFGDPVDGRFQVRLTSDGGATWQPVKDDEGLRALPDEGAFAASGTCLTMAGSGDAWFATGGALNSRVFHSKDGGRTWQAAAVPVAAGAPARGLFSVGFRDPQVGIAAGGDYKDVNLAGVNGARTEDGGASWTPVQVLPAGYMSVVVPVRGAPDAFVAAGLAGSGYSADAGKSWKILDRTPVNTAGFASPAAGWAVGPKGLVLKYTGAPLDR
ncbi:MAG TPA: hypothetical protein VF774_14700 [Pseudoduganella sp.]